MSRNLVSDPIERRTARHHAPAESIRDTWRDDALCNQAPSGMFFVEGTGHANEARRLCNLCPTRAACLAFAMEAEKDAGRQMRHGVYGGLGPIERWNLHRAGWVVGDPLPPVRHCGDKKQETTA